MSDQFLVNFLRNEVPMDSALNAAHFNSRRAENHHKKGRYDDAIKYHKETVTCLSKAISESTIPQNIENLVLQRNYHENIQKIISRQKGEFEDFLRRNNLQAVGKKLGSNVATSKENKKPPRTVVDSLIDDSFEVIYNNEFFSLVGEMKINENNELKPVKTDDNSDDGDEEYFSLR